MYYNTTNETGEVLKRAKQKTLKQDSRIMSFFESHPGHWTPCEVWQQCMPNVPITSVRRSITNLTDQGRLEKTDKKKQGIYGRPNYTWKLSMTLF
jgi:Fe2+ or Zn2+ uptake regulation protein